MELIILITVNFLTTNFLILVMGYKIIKKLNEKK